MTWGDLFPPDLYFTSSYNKTANVLVALRGILGEKLLHQALRDYGRQWVGRHPAPVDFFNSINTTAGRDLSWFWTTWFYNAWGLDQALGPVVVHGDTLAVTVEDRGLAPMPVRLAITRKGGAVQRIELPVEVWLTGKRTTTSVTVASGAGEVMQVEIDPEGLFPDLDRTNQVWRR
jgi:aminopeptidase N